MIRIYKRYLCFMEILLFFFSSRRRHTRWPRDWSSDVCSSDLGERFQTSVVVMRLATLTSGGDCPGLNAVIRAIVRTASNEFGDTVVGYEDGWVGLMEERRRELYNNATIDQNLMRCCTNLGTRRMLTYKY